MTSLKLVGYLGVTTPLLFGFVLSMCMIQIHLTRSQNKEVFCKVTSINCVYIKGNLLVRARVNISVNKFVTKVSLQECVLHSPRNHPKKPSS